MEVSTITGSTPDVSPNKKPASPPEIQRNGVNPLAQEFEAAFLAEMLKYTGLGENEGAFSGGYGEQAFKSFLIEAYAKDMAQTAPIGIADALSQVLPGEGESR